MNGPGSSLSTLWMAPLNFDESTGLSELKELDTYISELSDTNKEPKDVSRFYSGDPMTITFRGAMILECEDLKFRRNGRDVEFHPLCGGEGNDLLVLSTHQFGTDPRVEKIHFMEKGKELGYVDDFKNRRILTNRDFKDLQENLTLFIKIYDIDKMDTEFIDSAKSLAGSAIATIPVLYQYSIPLMLATSTLDSMTKLIDNLDQHDKIIEERIDFEATDSRTGHPLLQQGYVVIFRNEVGSNDAKYLQLVGDKLKVLNPRKEEFTGCSYAIVEINKNFRLYPEEEIDEKAAKLASELSGKGQSGKAALDFLRDTMKVYGNFRKLERIKELKSKDPSLITPSEKNLLEDLMKDPEIQEYAEKL
jgi:hypothetical protein